MVEILLILPPLVVGERGVIARGGDAVIPQAVAHPLDAGARCAVNDAAPSLTGEDNIAQLRALVKRMTHLEKQVRPVKAGDDEHRALQAEQTYNIAPDLLRRRGGEGGDGDALRQRCYKVRYAQVARTEILPPLGYAVGLVDGYHG